MGAALSTFVVGAWGVCVCVCVRAGCVGVCAHVCVWVAQCVRARTRTRVREHVCECVTQQRSTTAVGARAAQRSRALPVCSLAGALVAVWRVP